MGFKLIHHPIIMAREKCCRRRTIRLLVAERTACLARSGVVDCTTPPPQPPPDSHIVGRGKKWCRGRGRGWKAAVRIQSVVSDCEGGRDCRPTTTDTSEWYFCHLFDVGLTAVQPLSRAYTIFLSPVGGWYFSSGLALSSAWTSSGAPHYYTPCLEASFSFDTVHHHNSHCQWYYCYQRITSEVITIYQFII